MCEIKERIVNKLQLLVDGDVRAYLGVGFDDGWARVGLCSHISIVAALEHGTLYNIFKTWEHYSGDKQFPVPPPPTESITPHDYYQEIELYEGHQLEMRQSLAQHIINNIDLLVLRGQ